MKKIIIGPSYPLRGGISQSNYALQSYFEDQGEDVGIISYSLQYPKFLFPGKQQTAKSLERNVKNTFNLINTLNPFSWIKVAKWISVKITTKTRNYYGFIMVICGCCCEVK